MLNADRTSQSRRDRSGWSGFFNLSLRHVRSRLVMLPAVLAVAATTGCSQREGMERGYADQGKTQIQFYEPPGALVTVAARRTRTHQVATYGPFAHRLEHTPEEFAVFNLSPGTYEFKYTSVEGLPGVSIYGELHVERPRTREGRMYQRRAFIPISLPSEYYRRVEVLGDERYPWRGEAFRTAIDAHDIERLRLGDVVEKVFVVADLKDAERRLERTLVAIAEQEREIEYADARFRYAYLDFRADVTDSHARFWGKDRNFIRWERRRQEREQRMERMIDELTRTRALMAGDTVLSRRGMLVLATEQVVQAHRDLERSADRLGEVLVVMRVGGRHMHWGEPARDLIVYGQ